MKKTCNSLPQTLKINRILCVCDLIKVNSQQADYICSRFFKVIIFTFKYLKILDTLLFLSDNMEVFSWAKQEENKKCLGLISRHPAARKSVEITMPRGHLYFQCMNCM